MKRSPKPARQPEARDDEPETIEAEELVLNLGN
jgi:hypothetical protein